MSGKGDEEEDDGLLEFQRLARKKLERSRDAADLRRSSTGTSPNKLVAPVPGNGVSRAKPAAASPAQEKRRPPKPTTAPPAHLLVANRPRARTAATHNHAAATGATKSSRRASVRLNRAKQLPSPPATATATAGGGGVAPQPPRPTRPVPARPKATTVAAATPQSGGSSRSQVRSVPRLPSSAAAAVVPTAAQSAMSSPRDAKTYQERWATFQQDLDPKRRIYCFQEVFKSLLCVMQVDVRDQYTITELLSKPRNQATLQGTSLPRDSVLLMESASALMSRVVRLESTWKAVIHLQAHVRGFLARRRFARWRQLYLVSPLRERNRCFVRLLAKERSYVNTLHMIVHSYLIPLRAETRGIGRMVRAEDVGMIFSNIETILLVHRAFLKELTTLLDQWPAVDDVGAVFIRMAPDFNVYGEYVNNFKQSQDSLRVLEQSQKFQRWLEAKADETLEASDGLQLATLLSLPVNHLSQYRMMLSQLLDNTPMEHPGQDSLANSASLMSHCADYIANCLEGASNRARMEIVQRRIVSPKGYHILQDRRRLISVDESGVSIAWTNPEHRAKPFDGALLLCSDVLVVCKVKRVKSGRTAPLSVKSTITLEDACLMDSGEAASVLLLSGASRFVMKFSTASPANRFQDGLREAIAASQKNRIFGTPLQVLWERPDCCSDWVPHVVREMTTALLHPKKVCSEGLFRISGQNSTMNSMQMSVDKGIPVSFTDHDVNDVAGLLKQFFRELPEPLMTFALYGDFMAAYLAHESSNDSDAFLSTVQALLARLPEGNFALLRFVLRFLYEVTTHSDVNMMRTANISICFAPNFMYAEHETLETSLQVTKVNSILTFMLEHLPQLFGDA